MHSGTCIGQICYRLNSYQAKKNLEYVHETIALNSY